MIEYSSYTASFCAVPLGGMVLSVARDKQASKHVKGKPWVLDGSNSTLPLLLQGLPVAHVY